MSTLSDKFGLSKDQARAALDFLEVDVNVFVCECKIHVVYVF